MNLYYKELGEGQPLLILHGLFGSSDNWHTLGRALSQKFRVVIPDLRNHGQSPQSEDWSYEIMANDILDLCEKQGLTNIYLAGHSMGGKTALQLSQLKPGLVKKLMVIDIAPRYYQPHHKLIFDAIDAAEATGLNSRKEAESAMQKVLTDHGTVQFLSKNLFWKTPEKLGWRFNAKDIRRKIEEVGKVNRLDGFPSDIQVMFLRGGRSNYINEQDVKNISTEIPGAIIKTIEGAGHWLHAEKPHETLQCMEDFFG